MYINSEAVKHMPATLLLLAMEGDRELGAGVLGKELERMERGEGECSDGFRVMDIAAWL